MAPETLGIPDPDSSVQKQFIVFFRDGSSNIYGNFSLEGITFLLLTFLLFVQLTTKDSLSTFSLCIQNNKQLNTL